MIQKFEALEILEYFFPPGPRWLRSSEKNTQKSRGLQIFESFETKIGLEHGLIGWVTDFVSTIASSPAALSTDKEVVL